MEPSLFGALQRSNFWGFTLLSFLQNPYTSSLQGYQLAPSYSPAHISSQRASRLVGGVRSWGICAHLYSLAFYGKALLTWVCFQMVSVDNIRHYLAPNLLWQGNLTFYHEVWYNSIHGKISITDSLCSGSGHRSNAPASWKLPPASTYIAFQVALEIIKIT